jgi:hypothetical protein
MPEAPHDRPSPATVLREYDAAVPGSPDSVFAALVRVLTPDSAEVNFLADKVERLIVVQGGWWYRGEYRVLDDLSGSKVTFTLVNVAPTAHWAGPVTGRTVIRNSERDFAEVIATLA